MKFYSLLPAALLLIASCSDVTDYVDPRIGSEGLGRTVVAPSCPFGMVKPSPDCTPSPNSGWLPMPERVDGFAQVHVSGTGGGPKYGNILIQPFTGELEGRHHYAHRRTEEIALGYYSAVYEENDIKTEVTTAQRASFYRISYPAGSQAALLVDAGFFLGENPVPKAREAQQFEASFTEAVSDYEVRGWSRISGGWNNGAPYTVYFHLCSDTPFSAVKHWEENGRQGELLSFTGGTVGIKIGISFLSMDKALQNLKEDIPHWSFGKVRKDCVAQWRKELEKIRVKGDKAHKRMFYTGLYHTMLMPVDRKGEWEKAAPDEPYYDDYYAIWDTYRSSTPLLAIMDPQREAEIVNSLLTIYKHDGFLPDARSGNSNGRTQGGSNAEIVIADAFVKNLPGIDWELALQAMINDAEVVPEDDEAEGRGALMEYNSLGYVPWGIDRAGNRTVEYAMCDYAIYVVAKGLGHNDIAEKYLKRSSNWKNLWREDTVCDSVAGFIMPRDASGRWLDDLPFGHSRVSRPTYRYTTTMFEGPWYTKWWSSFFYEASSWEYSLSVPHDVPGLIQACGGEEAFEKRLDTFFGHGYYNVNNEPSFLTPCLYHWIGKPEKTSARVLQIIRDCFNDGPAGVPGNDDSGAMSSWLAFHMTGIYPLAGDTLYVIHTPVFKESSYKLANGKTFTIKADGLSGEKDRIASIKLNGKPHPSFFLSHSELMQGGVLELKMTSKDRVEAPLPVLQHNLAPEPGTPAAITDTLQFTYKLHGQTRRFDVWFDMYGDSLRYNWTIDRNLRTWNGSYTMSPKALAGAGTLSFRMPEDGNHLVLPDNEIFNVLPLDAYRQLEKTGRCKFNNTVWKLAGSTEVFMCRRLLHLEDTLEGAQMWVLDNPALPLICRMQNNPHEQDWSCSSTNSLRRQILADIGKMGSIYYAYPVHTAQPLTSAPEGYKPVYLSHYGRHGSRYLTDDSRYGLPLDFFLLQRDRNNLTEKGEQLCDKLGLLWQEVHGMGGMLSSLGAQQHAQIATRMYDNYPTVFVPGAKVSAASSIRRRCIDSMDAFCETLMQLDPYMAVFRASTDSTMTFIAPGTADIKTATDETKAFWSKDFQAFEKENIYPERLASSLLKNTSVVDNYKLFDYLYWIVVGMQDIPSELDFSDLFTAEELFGKWRTINYRMYVANCYSPTLGSLAPESCRPALEHIISRADAALEGNGVNADLRFGHDTFLIRLMSLMGIRECSVRQTNPELFWCSWKDWDVMPMAGNLQMVFYRKGANDPVLVKFLLNEKETMLALDNVKSVNGPYYDWEEVKSAWRYLVPVSRNTEEQMEKGPYKPDWESLVKQQTPEWFQDAKFGIWAHWGPQCVEGTGDWMARHMYCEGSKEYNFHREHYGHPSEFGFKDVLPLFKAENWDPDALVKLYKETGARYFFALGNHHDNYDLWDSKHQKWNSKNIGPHRDVLGEWEAAARKYGLPFGISLHADHSWLWYEVSQGADKQGDYAGVPYDGNLTAADGVGKWWEGYDPQMLYAQNHPLSLSGNTDDWWGWEQPCAALPSQEFVDNFFNRSIDVINRYNPDLIYYDATAVPFYPVSDAGMKITTHLYNHSANRNGGVNKAVAFGKILDDTQKKALTWDVERGAPNMIVPYPWQTCTCIGGWHYNQRTYDLNRYKSAANVIRMLADVVSKNGCLLLSIPLRSDGTFDDKEEVVIKGIGAWMRQNGEAIYETRPWKVFGEGPIADSVIELRAQGFNEGSYVNAGADEIRFTTKGDTLYAIALAWPQNGEILVRSLADGSELCPDGIAGVQLIGYGSVDFQRTADGLKVYMPTEAINEIAPAMKITFCK